MIIAKGIVQGTKEWDDIRMGIPTASGFDKIITTKGTSSKQREKYMYGLAAERISGIKEDQYQNAIMQRGIEMEGEARAFYELTTGQDVKTVGFCHYDKKKLFGCSPDGLVGKGGSVEIKCPSSAVHVAYLLNNKLPIEYFQQVQGQLLVTGRKWVDFFSFYPGVKPLCIRIEPDGRFLNNLQVELEVFCKELNEVTEKIRR